MERIFERFATATAQVLGSFWVFAGYCALLVVWLVFGPLAHWDDTWQLVANTITSLATTAICLLIQSTVNRDSKALHLKMDELLRAVGEARTGMIDLEHLPEADLRRLQGEMTALRESDARAAGEGAG